MNCSENISTYGCGVQLGNDARNKVWRWTRCRTGNKDLLLKISLISVQFGNQLAIALGEKDPDTIKKIVNAIGRDVALKLFEETKVTEQNGGMNVCDLIIEPIIQLIIFRPPMGAVGVLQEVFSLHFSSRILRLLAKPKTASLEIWEMPISKDQRPRKKLSTTPESSKM